MSMPLTNSKKKKKSTSLVTVVSVFDIFGHFIFDKDDIYVNHTAGKLSFFFKVIH